MRIISSLALRYMRLNRKRTAVTIVGIILSMEILTTVVAFSDALFSMMADRIREENGSYQVILHNLNENQVQELGLEENLSIGRSSHCLHDTLKDGGSCVEIEFPKIGRDIFSRTFSLCEHIGMQKLPDEERMILPDQTVVPYNVSFNTDLLELYGVGLAAGIGIRGAVLCIELLVVLLASLIMYNSFAISAFEKASFLGTLGSIGASRMQKAGVIYMEGLCEGAVGIPAGIAIGAVSLRGLSAIIRRYLTIEIKADLPVKSVAGVALLGIVLLVLSCSLPALRATGSSDIELSRKQLFIPKKVRRATNISGVRGGRQLSFKLSLKNAWLSRGKYLAYIAMMSVVICLIVDGVAYTRGLQGDYYPKEDREKPALDVWTELYTMDTEAIDSVFTAARDYSGTRLCSEKRILEWGGILIPEEYSAYDPDRVCFGSELGFSEAVQKVRSSDSGKVFSGIRLHPLIIGLDDDTFERYRKKCGFSSYDGESYPVIIDDYLAVNIDGDKTRYEILNISEGSEFEFKYSMYGDMDDIEALPDREEGRIINVDSLLEGSMYCLGCTDQMPDVPYFSEIHEDIEGRQETVMGNLHIYMPMSSFNEFIRDPQYSSTYGHHPEDTAAFNYIEDKSVRTIINVLLAGPAAKANAAYGSRFMNDVSLDKSVINIINAAAIRAGVHETRPQDSDRNYGVMPEMNGGFYTGSRALWMRDRYLKSNEVLKLVLAYGTVILITFFVLTNLLYNISTSIRVRRRELAMLQSVGMSIRQIRGMLTAENLLLGVAGWAVGTAISLFMLIGVRQDFDWYILEWKMPWDMMALETCIMVLLAVIPLMHVRGLVRKLNIIESIKDVNL